LRCHEEHYNYFRDYDPALGRYLKSDPAGLWAGRDTFGYAQDSPLRFIDSLGLAATAPGSEVVSVCGGIIRDYYHRRVCVGDSCWGLMPGENPWWGKGRLQFEPYDQKQCSPFAPLCDRDAFTSCVRNEIKKTFRDPGIYSLPARNCFTWSNLVINECEAKACLASLQK